MKKKCGWKWKCAICAFCNIIIRIKLNIKPTFCCHVVEELWVSDNDSKNRRGLFPCYTANAHHFRSRKQQWKITRAHWRSVKMENQCSPKLAIWNIVAWALSIIWEMKQNTEEYTKSQQNIRIGFRNGEVLFVCHLIPIYWLIYCKLLLPTYAYAGTDDVREALLRLIN